MALAEVRLSKLLIPTKHPTQRPFDTAFARPGSQPGPATVTGSRESEQWDGKRIVAFIQGQQYGRIQGAAFRLLSTAPN
jgi:hypothetical protein